MAIAIGRRARRGVEALLDALADPARRERAAALTLLCYVALWTLYGVFSKGAQDIHFDMAEAFAWSRELAIGYAKHPPLSAVAVAAWFAVFPATDWAYYLLSMANAGLALWLIWRLAGDYVDDGKRAVGLALITLLPFFNFHALKFNANTVLLPTWAATTLFFLRSYETRSLRYAALAGFAAALAMLGKYWSIVLLAGLALAALLDSRRRDYFRSPAPWVTAGVGLVALAPHLVWLIANDFLPFAYARAAHPPVSWLGAVAGALGYLAGAAAYVAVPVALALLAMRPGRATLADLAAPAQPERRRLMALAFWLPLLLPVPFAIAARTEISSLWTMSAWSLLPAMLLSSPRADLPREAATRIVAVAVALPIVMLAAAPAIGAISHRLGAGPPAAISSRLLAEEVAHAWRQTSDRPLRFVASASPDLAYGVAFYLSGRPLAVSIGDPLRQPERDQAMLRDGVAYVCPREDADCIARIEARAWRGPAGLRREVELVRRHFGVAGMPARYVILTVPPEG